NPCSLFGQVSVAERAAVPLPVTCCPDAMRIARMSAALGCIELFAIGAPDGYQPSTKYWRMMAAAAAAAGVESLVPAQCASETWARLNGSPSDIAESPSKIVTIVGLIRPSVVGPRLDCGAKSF